MKKIIATTLLAMSLTVYAKAQQSVAIGAPSTNDNAVLLLVGNGNQGLVIPIVSNEANIATPSMGMVVYVNTGTPSTSRVMYHNGSGWAAFGGGGGANLIQIAGNTVTVGTGSADNDNLANTPPALGTPGQILMWDGTNWTSSTSGAPAPGSVLKWNIGLNRWEPGTDNVGSGAPLLFNGQIMTGNGVSNTNTILAGDATLNVGTLTISNNAVTTSKIINDAVTSAKILDGTIGQGDLSTSMNYQTSGTITTVGAGGHLTISGSTTFNGRTYAWPGAAAGIGTFLQNNGSGILTWAPLAASTNLDALSDVTISGAADAHMLIKNGAGDFTNRLISGDIAINNLGNATISNTSGTGANIITSINAAVAGTINTSRLGAPVVLDTESPAAGDITGTFAAGLQIGANAVTNAEIANVDAGKVTTGTLPIARGGTGLSLTTPANGSLLIGNGTGFANALLTGGPGVNITSGAGSISVSNTWLANPFTTTGDIIYGIGTTPTRLAAGASGNVLTAQGPGTAPIWQAPTAGFSTTNVIPKGNGSTLVASSLFDNGNVGIGNTNPQANLHIHGAVNGSLRITNPSTGTTTGDGIDISIDGAGAGTIFSRENAVLTLGANSNGTLYLSPTGLVGININNPSQPLDVAGNVEFSGSLLPAGVVGAAGAVLTSAGVAGLPPTWTTIAASIAPINTVIRGDATGTLQVASSFFDDGAYTAINRSFPIGAARFDIGTNAISGNYGGMYVDTQIGGLPFYGFSQGGGGGAWIEWDGSDANKMKFDNGGPRMTIQSDGFVGIGTTTPSTQFEISALSPQLTLRTTGAGVNESAILRFVNGGGTLIGSIGDSGSSTQLELVSPTSISFNTNFTVRGAITNTGNFTINAPTSGTALDVTGLGNWDLSNTEGDFKVGSATHRLKAGIALSGGGAGDTYVAAHGGTNRLFLGTAETFANTQTLTLAGGSVGVGTTTPVSRLDVEGGAVIGSAFSGTTPGPLNGLLVETSIGVGIPATLAGVDVSIPGASTLANGFKVSNAYNGGLNKIGIQNILTSNGSGPKYAVFNDVSGTAGDASGVLGTYNSIIPNGTGTAYGTYNVVASAGTGQRFGLYNNIASAGGNASALYGNYTSVNHGGTGTVYGAFIDANKAASQAGTLYGLNVTTDNDGTGDSYLLYGNAIGSTTGKEWGLYVTGEDENFFSSTVTFTTPSSGSVHAIRITREGTPANYWYEGSRASDGDRYHGYNGAFKGNWNIADGSYTSASDRRLKKNIESLPSVLSNTMALRPVRYHMNEQNNTDQKRTGLIAQDVNELFPEFVSYNKEQDIFSLNYASMSVIAIKAIQEQQALIDNQQAEIELLKSDMEAIKQSLREIQSKTRQP